MRVQPIKNMKAIKSTIKYLKETNTRNYLIFSIGCNSGLRISDIVTLTPDKFDFDNNQLIIKKEQKTKKSKIVQVNKALMNEFKKFINANNLNDNSYIFTSTTRGTKTAGRKKHLSRQQGDRILKALANVVSIIGLPKRIGTHTLRKTYAYQIYIQSGKNLHLVMELLNHASERITLRYLDLVEDLEKGFLDKLAMY